VEIVDAAGADVDAMTHANPYGQRTRCGWSPSTGRGHRSPGPLAITPHDRGIHPDG
jgi:hypothetical protein